MKEREATRWQVGGCSVRGAAHRRADTHNQDDHGWWEAPDDGGHYVLCVSDGHGGVRYFRSGVGAQLAVETGISILRKFIADANDIDVEPARRLPLIEQEARDRLPHDLVKSWRDAVKKHAESHPFTEDEFLPVEEREGPAAVEKVAADPVIAYGATFLACVTSPEYVLFLQLGDGDIVIVDEGEANFALPEDERLIGNETTSLCEQDASKKFRARFQPIAEKPPDLILLSTDGYSNSFASDLDFLKVGTDFLELLRQEGFEYVSESLEGWLNESSEKGSGDDVTVGFLYREEQASDHSAGNEGPEDAAPTEMGTPEDGSLEEERRAKKEIEEDAEVEQGGDSEISRERKSTPSTGVEKEAQAQEAEDAPAAESRREGLYRRWKDMLNWIILGWWRSGRGLSGHSRRRTCRG